MSEQMSGITMSFMDVIMQDDLEEISKWSSCDIMRKIKLMGAPYINPHDPQSIELMEKHYAKEDALLGLYKEAISREIAQDSEEIMKDSGKTLQELGQDLYEKIIGLS